ncbi:MAG: hypothetical protein HYZ37_03115 [Candidatus Solibacter usitatus]|nr:hypothetical protein [Candidatus Solibacter usitatus]
MDQVFHRLLAIGKPPHEIAQFVSPVLTLAGDQALPDDDGGLALFVDPQEFFCFEAPADIPELTTVGTHFHVRPLLCWLAAGRDFLVLDLGPETVRLFRCAGSSMSKLSLPRGVPERLHELEGHPSSEISFNIGAANEDRRSQFVCRMIDRGLHSVLQESAIPLVICGMERFVTVYRRESTYPHTLTNVSVPAPANAPPQDWIRRVRGLIVKEHCQQATRHLVEMEEYPPGERWSATPENILRSAAEGRVWQLFLAKGAELEGELHHGLKEDLLNAAAVEVLIHGGEVFDVSPAEIPANAPMAALFRYSAA